MLACSALCSLSHAEPIREGRRWVILPPDQLPGELRPTLTPVGGPSPSIPIETESPTLAAARASPFASPSPRLAAWLQQPVYAGLPDLAGDFNVSAPAALERGFAILPAAVDASGVLSNTSIIAVAVPSAANMTASPCASQCTLD